MTTGNTWEPVLRGDEVDHARRVIEEIGAALADIGATGTGGEGGPALLDGLAGRALFFAQRNAAEPARGHRSIADRLVSEAVEGSDSVADLPGLFSGITGLAWTIQHLAPAAGASHLQALDDIDASIVRALAEPSSEANFELMQGLVGVGVFALERLPSPMARTALERMVAWLDASAERGTQGLSWRAWPSTLHSAARAEFPSGCHYPGVAHGTAGVIGFLAGVLRAGVAPGAVAGLLEGAVRWLLAQELPGEEALFPFQADGSSRRPPSRSAWCTGGPGISLMLWRAGHAAGERTWQDLAARLARTAMRRPLDEMGVRDACLCHGTAGLGQLYARWFHNTGDEDFRQEAARWFRRTFEHQRPGQGVAGFSALNAPQNRWEPAPGFLFGAAGIGLALLSASTAVAPAWDRVLLMSDPPRSVLDGHNPSGP